MIERHWLALLLVLGSGAAFLAAGILLMPREPEELATGKRQSLRYSFDPHLFLSVDEVSSEPDAETPAIRATVVASNTAVGDLAIDLSALRLALVTTDDETLEPIEPVW